MYCVFVSVRRRQQISYTLHNTVLMRAVVFLCVCFETCALERGVGIIRVCQTTALSCFVAVIDSHKMKGRMEAESRPACCLKKLTLVAIAAGHEGQVCT